MSGGGNPSTNDQSQKEHSISLAASSMINASDMITAETYHENAKRIQNVKEMAWRLELNNEAAHKNFLVDQLEKRAKDGREAENMLTQLRNRPGLSATVQFTNNAAIDKSEVILPTTATLAEVPDSNPSPSYSSPTITNTPTHLPQNVQQGYPVTAPQAQPRYSGFPYYMTPPMASLSLHHNATPYTQAPVNTAQTGWYTTQNQPSQPRVHNPSVQTSSQRTRTQPPLRSWSGHPPQVVVPNRHRAPVPGGWNGITPSYFPPSTSSTNPTYGAAGILVQSDTPRPPVATYNQSSNFASQVQVPAQGVPSAPAKPSVAQPPIGPYPTPAESQSQHASTAVPKSTVVLESQQLQKPPEQPQRPGFQSQPQRLPTPQSQPQPQAQQLSQPLHKSQQFQQSHTRHLSHQPPQPHEQTPPPPVDGAPSASALQSHGQPQRVRDFLPVDPSPRMLQTLLQPTIVQGQVRQGGTQQHQIDQAMFIKLFQNAVQRGTLQLQTFWMQARASGITEEWFKVAINSLPRGVWEAIIAQRNQSGHRSDARPQSTQQQVLASPSTNVSMARALPPSTANTAVKTASTAQQAAERGISAEGDATHSISRQISGPYVTELQYYADQATKLASSPQTASVSMSLPGGIAPTQITTATHKRDAPQITANVRTPKDANKSTLARDVLRALGRTVEKSHQEMRGELANNIQGDKLTEVNPSRTDSRPASTKPPLTSLEASSADANSSPISSANPSAQNVPQRIVSPCQPIMKSVLKEESGQHTLIEGPIMIDLTLEDSDESIDGKGQEPFLMQASTSPAVSPRPVSTILTINDTPLLESLSLEEPTASAEGSNDNADVRMCSPPSGLVVEENTGSEHFYSPPGSAEPVSQSFELLSNEAREHQVDGQLPLFLPSPPVSPVHTEPPTTDPEMVHDEDESGLAQKRRSMDVDKVEIGIETATPLCVRKRRRRQVYVLIPPAPLYVKKAKMKARAMKGRDLSFEGVEQDEEIQYNHLEQLLIEESKSHLFERQCRWLNCTAILNCAANLLIHLRNHAREEASEAPFLCRWTTCQRQFGMEQERGVHLERHTIRPLPCPFAGCDKQFDKPIEVMLHEVQHKGEPVTHRSTCLPTVPAIPARLGAPPHWLPSHRVIPRRVAKCQMSADRHATVGPWVLWNIFSPVELSVRKQNTSMRGRLTRPVIIDDKDSSDSRRDDYDFLLALSSSSAKQMPLDDLDSTLITMSAARGLTLWGSGGTTVPDEVTSTSVVREEEEEDVERMLTV